AHAINPFPARRIPARIADRGLAGAATGLSVGGPAHSTRYCDCARQHKLPIRRVISVSHDAAHEPLEAAFEAYEGVLVNSGPFNGLSVKEGIERITADAERKHIGQRTITYRLRDWLISRQRYWGV